MGTRMYLDKHKGPRKSSPYEPPKHLGDDGDADEKVEAASTQPDGSAGGDPDNSGADTRSTGGAEQPSTPVDDGGGDGGTVVETPQDPAPEPDPPPQDPAPVVESDGVGEDDEDDDEDE